MAGVTELVGMEEGELEQRLSEARQELFNLRFQVATGQLDNTARIGQVRREVARVLTVLRQREIEAAETLIGGGTPEGAVPAGPVEVAAARRRSTGTGWAARRRAARSQEAGDEVEAAAEDDVAADDEVTDEEAR